MNYNIFSADWGFLFYWNNNIFMTTYDVYQNAHGYFVVIFFKYYSMEQYFIRLQLQNSSIQMKCTYVRYVPVGVPGYLYNTYSTLLRKLIRR